MNDGTTKGSHGRIGRRALAVAANAGRLPKNILDLVDIDAEPPSVQARDRLKETQADQILVGERVMSRQTLAARHGLDYGVERGAIEDEQEAETGFVGTVPQDRGEDDPADKKAEVADDADAG